MVFCSLAIIFLFLKKSQMFSACWLMSFTVSALVCFWNFLPRGHDWNLLSASSHLKAKYVPVNYTPGHTFNREQFMWNHVLHFRNIAVFHFWNLKVTRKYLMQNKGHIYWHVYLKITTKWGAEDGIRHTGAGWCHMARPNIPCRHSWQNYRRRISPLEKLPSNLIHLHWRWH